jgi:hypothetical protein
MYSRRIALTASLLAPLTLATAVVIAGEKDEHGHKHEDAQRQHGAHVHGIAALNVALEGEEVHVELDSPAANIVGFEHAPSSEADHAALDKAVATLKAGDQLFKFNPEAGCRMEKTAITSALLDEEHGKHGSEHADDHGHEKKEVHGDETHSDIDAVYHFECDQPGKLTQLTVELFEAFSGMAELSVQYVIETKQGAAELTPANHVVKF